MIDTNTLASLDMMRQAKKDAYESVIDMVGLAQGGLFVAQAEVEMGYDREDVLRHLNNIREYLTDVEMVLTALRSI